MVTVFLCLFSIIALLAITRAKNELYLTYPLIRGGFGASGADTYQTPSRFLSEIPKSLLNEWNLR